MIRFLGLMLGALSLFVLISCILGGDKVAKRGSEVENELGVYGTLVDESGNPVAGATVKARPSASGIGKISAIGSAHADSDSVATDAKGKYTFRKLGKGSYDVFGDFKSGSLVVLIPGVAIRDTGLELEIGTDTLRAPGRIRGQLLLADKGRTPVFVYVPGTSYLAVSDDSGRFVLSGVPQGRYSVSYSAAGYAIDPDTGVAVLAGRTTDLPPRLLDYDPALPPPAPQGLMAVVDTTDGTVTLTWNTVRVSDLGLYLVYRDSPGEEPHNIGFARDTIFHDYPGLPQGEITRFTYRVRSRDSDLNVSTIYSNTSVIPVYRSDWAYNGMTWVSPADEIVPQPDSLVLAVRFHAPGVRNREILWFQDGRSAPLRTTLFYSVDGSDSLVWKPGAGRYRIEARLVDLTGGLPVSATHSFSIMQKGAKPVDAGADTTVAVGGVAFLHGKVDSAFGAIGLWQWDNESGPIPGVTPGYQGMTFIVPGGRDSLACVLHVKDSMGLAAADTMIIHVARPKGLDWRSVQPHPAFPGRLQTNVLAFQDKLWVMGGIHRFLRKDEEYDTLLSDIWSSADGTDWVKVTDSAAFGSGGVSAVFAGKMWVIGGGTRKGGGAYNDVWNSADGVHWDRIVDSAAFTPGSLGHAFVFQNRLWIHSNPGLNIIQGDSSKNPDCGEAWSSADGREWVREPWNLPFEPWGQIAVQAGEIKAFDFFGNVWSSPDGGTWTSKALPPAGLTNIGMAMLVFKGDLFVFGSMQGAPAGLWRIPPGGEPELVQDGLPFPLYQAYPMVFRDRIFIMADNSAGAGNYTSEIWSAP